MIRARVWESITHDDRRTWEPDPRGNNCVVHIDDMRKLLMYINGSRSESLEEAVAYFRNFMEENA